MASNRDVCWSERLQGERLSPEDARGNRCVPGKAQRRDGPQTFIGGERIGGYEDLRDRFTGYAKDADDKTDTHVLVILSVCALMMLAVSLFAFGSIFHVRAIELFGAFSMTVLAIQKLKDMERFSTTFLNYGFLVRRWVPYGYLYAFGEAAAVMQMIAGGMYGVIAPPIAVFIGRVGVVGVFRAVFVDKRELKCACVGGDSNVPLGFVSLNKNLAMMAMGLWLPLKFIT